MLGSERFLQEKRREIDACQVLIPQVRNPSMVHGCQRAAMDHGCPPGMEFILIRFLKAACYNFAQLFEIQDTYKGAGSLMSLYFFAGINFNNNFYYFMTRGVSLLYTDTHYLKSTGSAISLATSTTFDNNNVLLNSSLIQTDALFHLQEFIVLL